MSRSYPDRVAGPYDPPPHEFEDGTGRTVTIREFGGADAPVDDEGEALVEMYRAFDPEDRAQGIPPVDETNIREWLDGILAEDCLNVVAWHDASAVGHATLVPDTGAPDDESVAYELAIFVLSAYQGAGIGTHLMAGLLGLGRESGVDRVWLTVERWNRPAVALYENVGFEQLEDSGFELTMTARLQ
ncbi:GNAT family N-acetyltransferase [Halorarius halobius]|uniref:GNAT family N-acetyltransferase n=1 Tax=Halorarius halobius TaxID=2962671 RepID=UPI0020CB720B|nr:GNAT family N-acetyltransferase [Halorarius halobius]